MIVRIVKMQFKDDRINEFLMTFEKQKTYIAGFEGCTHLDLLRDKNNPTIFFTYSHWDDEQALEKYRNSLFFREIWQTVKQFFNDKPQAWSVEKYG